MLVGAVLAALGIHPLLFTTLDRVTRRTRSVIDNSLVRHSRGPARLLLPLVAVFLSLPATPLPEAFEGADPARRGPRPDADDLPDDPPLRGKPPGVSGSRRADRGARGPRDDLESSRRDSGGPPDASTARDLRCHVRERLIEYLQQHHPERLPRTCAEIRRDGTFEKGAELDEERLPSS
jgi:hypothetical protein